MSIKRKNVNGEQNNTYEPITGSVRDLIDISRYEEITPYQHFKIISLRRAYKTVLECVLDKISNTATNDDYPIYFGTPKRAKPLNKNKILNLIKRFLTPKKAEPLINKNKEVNITDELKKIAQSDVRQIIVILLNPDEETKETEFQLLDFSDSSTITKIAETVSSLSPDSEVAILDLQNRILSSRQDITLIGISLTPQVTSENIVKNPKPFKGFSQQLSPSFT